MRNRRRASTPAESTMHSKEKPDREVCRVGLGQHDTRHHRPRPNRTHSSAPAACWWARLIEESTATTQSSSPAASASALTVVSNWSQVPSATSGHDASTGSARTRNTLAPPATATWSDTATQCPRSPSGVHRPPRNPSELGSSGWIRAHISSVMTHIRVTARSWANC